MPETISERATIHSWALHLCCNGAAHCQLELVMDIGQFLDYVMWLRSPNGAGTPRPHYFDLKSCSTAGHDDSIEPGIFVDSLPASPVSQNAVSADASEVPDGLIVKYDARPPCISLQDMNDLAQLAERFSDAMILQGYKRLRVTDHTQVMSPPRTLTHGKHRKFKVSSSSTRQCFLLRETNGGRPGRQAF